MDFLNMIININNEGKKEIKVIKVTQEQAKSISELMKVGDWLSLGDKFSMLMDADGETHYIDFDTVDGFEFVQI